MISRRSSYRVLMSTSCLCLVVGLGSVSIPAYEAQAANNNWAHILPEGSDNTTTGNVDVDGLTVTYQPNSGQEIKQFDRGGTVKIQKEYIDQDGEKKTNPREPDIDGGLTLIQDGPGKTILQSNQDYSSITRPMLDANGNPQKDADGNDRMETISRCDEKVNCINYQVKTIIKQGTLEVRGNSETLTDDAGYGQGTLPNTTVEVQKGATFNVAESNGWRNPNGSSSGVAVGGLNGSGTIALGSSGQLYLHKGPYDAKYGPDTNVFTGNITADSEPFHSSGLIVDQKTLELRSAATNEPPQSVQANLIWVGNNESDKATLNIDGGSQVTVFRDLTTGVSVTKSNNSATDGTVNISGTGTKVTVDGNMGIASSEWFYRAQGDENGANISEARKEALQAGLSNVQGAVSITDGANVSAAAVALGYEGDSGNYWNGIAAGNGLLTVGKGDAGTSNALLSVGLTQNASALDGYSLQGNGGLRVNARGNGIVNINDGGQLATSKIEFGADANAAGARAGAVHGDLNLNKGGLLQVFGTGAAAENDRIVNKNLSSLNQRGTFTLNGGTFQAIGGDLYGSMDLNFGKPDADSKSIIDTNNHNVVLAGQMTGDGGFKKVSAGNLTLGALALGRQDDEAYLEDKGRNTYTGGTDIEQGKVSGTAGAFGNGPISVVNGATMDVYQGTSKSDSVTTPGGTSNNTNTLGDDKTTLSGAGQFDKRGDGTLYYEGDGSGFTGNMDVQAGNMVVNGNLGRAATTVASGAGLAGTGTVGNTDVHGTLSPGQRDSNAPIGGTLNVNGNLTMHDGSTFYARADETKAQEGQSDSNQRATDFVNVSGAADLGGANLSFNVLNKTALKSGEIYKLVEANNGITNQFKGWNSDAVSVEYQNLKAELVYVDGNKVAQIKVTDTRTPSPEPQPQPTPEPQPEPQPQPTPEPQPEPQPQPTPEPQPQPHREVDFHQTGETRNEKAAAVGLKRMIEATVGDSSLGGSGLGGGTLGDAAVSLHNGEQLSGALNSLSGEIYGSTKTAMVNDSFYLRDAAINRLDCAGDSVRGAGMTDKEHNPGYCDVDPNHPLTVWGQIYGSRGGNSGSSSNYLSAAHLNQSAVGWIMGADTEVQGWRVGGLMAYGRSMFSNGGVQSSNGSANNASIGAYGGTSWRVGGINPDARVTLKLGATYTWNVLQTHRRIEIPEFSDRTKSSSLAGTAQSFAETGYRFVTHMGKTPVEIEPFARMTYVSYQQGGYREHGGLAALSVKSQQSNLGYSTFGVKAATSFKLGNVTLSPHGSLAYRHAFGALRGTARERFNSAGGAYDMSVIGTPISANTAVINSGISAKLTNRLNVQVDYVGQYGSHLTTSGGTGKLSYSF